jgi:hypothetical protein
MSEFPYMVALVAVFAFVVLCNVLAVGCASDERAKEAAENIGLHHVVVKSKGFAFGPLGGCSQYDVAKFRVEGVDASGQLRSIQVCAQVPFGGYTVRS